MITVRFATGFSVQYNRANYLVQGENYGSLYEDAQRQNFVAQVPNDCLIEYYIPCRTYNPISPDPGRVQASVDLLAKDIRRLQRQMKQVSR